MVSEEEKGIQSPQHNPLNIYEVGKEKESRQQKTQTENSVNLTVIIKV